MTSQPLPPTQAQLPPYFAGLNEAQRRAVETVEGPVLVLAGAGTGKTRVLTTRLAHLLASGAARPWNILAVTFTNKAAREMRERVANIIGPSVEQVWLGTFHALCTRILRKHAELVGLKSNFTILDADDQVRLLKQVLEAEGIDDKRWPARVLMTVIQRWKDRALPPEKIGAAEAGDLAGGKLPQIYAAYQQRLKTLNAADFGDLLMHTVALFTAEADVLQQYQRQFRYLLVDEYQDTNVAQYLWLRLLAQGRHNICCVGDEDQSIYGWRGAEIGNILRFEADFPGAKVIRLEQNYRSTPSILAAASHLIANNKDRLGKTLWTEAEAGDNVKVTAVWDGEDEARRVGDEIEALQRKGLQLGQMAILVRAGFQTREFEERFITLGINYRVIGGQRFYERLEIRDALAYLRVVQQPDDDLAFERIINTPKRGIGQTTVQTLHKLARAQGVPLLAAASAMAGTDELKPAARRAIATVVEDFTRWRQMVDGVGPADLAQTVLDESGYTAHWQQDKSAEAPGRLENLKELVRAIGEFESLASFLEHVSLVMDIDEVDPGQQISLMTLHAAKGLEFDSVFLPGWEEGLFPHPRSLDENGNAGLEEERRLAYVGLTRARKRAYVTHAANRRIHNMWQSSVPSRFIGELPADAIEVEAESGLFGGSAVGGSYAGSIYESRPAAWLSQPRRQAPLIEGRAVNLTPKRSGGFPAGTRVFHQKFGYGTVRAVDGDKLEIEFEHAGLKKVMDSFVTAG
ncbi:MAG: UvrD-helicase domain-containing protein [Rhodospirillaceae bacterium]|nr:UvrD-helicase domain-containing protein [Rhodospirillaceae bacterium]